MRKQRKRGLEQFGKIAGGILAFIIAAMLCQMVQNLGTSSNDQLTPTPEFTPTPVYTEGTLTDFISAGWITVEAQGVGIDVLEIIIEKLVDELLSVEIPVGTFFVANTESSQNMVVIRSVTVQISVDIPVDVSLDVACANIHRDVPNEGDSFAIEAAPEQHDLIRLLESFPEDWSEPYDPEYHTYDVQQAAIWIVTDNANYDDLGILVRQSSLSGFIPSRVIRQEEAARAMRLVSEAGIEISKKAIWQDRELIIAGIEDDPELVAWLREH